MSNQIIEKAGRIIANEDASKRYCALALFDAEGYPTVSTITVSKSEGIRRMTFCTGLGGDKIKRIEKCNRAGVCFNLGGEHNITLVGEIEILTDAETKRSSWYEGLEYHFNGPDDPRYCVLRFTTKRYNLFIEGEETAGTL